MKKHGAGHPEVVSARTLFHRLCDDLKPHMYKEEAVLFPHIKALEQAVNRKTAMPFAPFGTVNNPVRMMMSEHDTAGDILRELRAATTDYAVPDDACMSYRALYEALEGFERDLHQHIHLENNVLFPRAVEAVAARLEEHNALEEERVYSWTQQLPAGEEAQLAVDIRRELANLPPRFNA